MAQTIYEAPGIKVLRIPQHPLCVGKNPMFIIRADGMPDIRVDLRPNVKPPGNVPEWEPGDGYRSVEISLNDEYFQALVMGKGPTYYSSKGSYLGGDDEPTLVVLMPME
jgi:hypothetical protein